MLICTREVWNSFKLSQLMFCNGGGGTIHNMFLVAKVSKSYHLFSYSTICINTAATNTTTLSVYQTKKLQNGCCFLSVPFFLGPVLEG